MKPLERLIATAKASPRSVAAIVRPPGAKHAAMAR